MDPPLVNEASFTAASNPSSYSLMELLSFPADGSPPEESTVTGQSTGKRINCFDDDCSDKAFKRSKKGDDESCGAKIELEGNSGTSLKLEEEKNGKMEPGKDYIHVRARRGQATDSHSLAERARREKISERMKILQDLVPGCNKVIGKALVLDEIINYIQSLQRQVEFLSMKLEAVNSRLSPAMEGFPPKNLATPSFDANGMLFGSQAPREYSQATPTEWLHMQVGSAFERAT